MTLGKPQSFSDSVWVYFTSLWSVSLEIEPNPAFSFSQMSPLFIFAQHKLTICSVIKESPFHMERFMNTKQRGGNFWTYHEIISIWQLFYVVSMTTVWVRPPIKPTSAVISSPKSFVIALICILQLSVLAHSKNNQPPLRTGDSIIIISVDLYKTLLTSLCLTSTSYCQASFTAYFHKYTYSTDGDG